MSEQDKKKCNCGCDDECDCNSKENCDCDSNCDCGCGCEEDIVELTTDDGKKLKFYLVGTIEYKGKYYSAFEPAETIDGIEDDDLVIFELSGEEEATADELLKKLQYIAEDKNAMLTLDKELSTRVFTPIATTEA